ncbi:MAG: hypothetical protein RMI39_06725 [Thermoanaerobaculum sp.]|nr:hypothetical protein [Thermoanaerobaculum sp.]
MKSLRFVCVLCLVLVPALLHAQDLEERVRQLEAQVQALQQQIQTLQGTADPQRLAELERQLAILAEELQRLRLGELGEAMAAPKAIGLAPAAAKVYAAKPGVSLGGYGEMLYQNFAATRQDGRPSGRVDLADAYRAVLYTGFKFDEAWIFNSELEVEHAHTGKGGAVELEFAYLDHLASPAVNLRLGVVLVPLGLVNELHEPTTFFPARRAETETRIIPSTWWELGIGAFGDVGPFSYRTYILTGLDASKFTAAGLRGGRQAAALAKAESLAWVGRLDWTERPELLAGVGVYLGEAGQDLKTTAGKNLRVPTRILEAHAQYKPGRWTLRGLWAEARVGEAGELNRRLALSGTSAVGRRLAGGYLEVAYDLLPAEKPVLAPFLRYEVINTQAAVPAGYRAHPANDQKLLTLGLAYQPIPQLIFKLDAQRVRNGAATGVNQWNLALGYVF